jgi:hypothetical protein
MVTRYARANTLVTDLHSTDHPSVLMTRAFRLRRFEREWLRGKPLHLRLMFGSAVRTLKAQHIGPDAGQGRVVNVKLKINRLSGLRTPTNEATHGVAGESEKEIVAASLLLAWLSSRDRIEDGDRARAAAIALGHLAPSAFERR